MIDYQRVAKAIAYINEHSTDLPSLSEISKPLAQWAPPLWTLHAETISGMEKDN